MTLDSCIGLVLEGGGMRGVFTSGVLDFMLDHDINFSYCVGVSAGACNGLSYLSRQRGRAKQTNIDLLDKYQYIGLKLYGRSTAFWTRMSFTTRFPMNICPLTMQLVLPTQQNLRW